MSVDRGRRCGRKSSASGSRLWGHSKNPSLNPDSNTFENEFMDVKETIKTKSLLSVPNAGSSSSSSHAQSKTMSTTFVGSIAIGAHAQLQNSSANNIHHNLMHRFITKSKRLRK